MARRAVPRGYLTNDADGSVMCWLVLVYHYLLCIACISYAFISSGPDAEIKRCCAPVYNPEVSPTTPTPSNNKQGRHAGGYNNEERTHQNKQINMGYPYSRPPSLRAAAEQHPTRSFPCFPSSAATHQHPQLQPQPFTPTPALIPTAYIFSREEINQ